MKAIPNKPTSDKQQLIQSWSKLTKGKVSYAEARDLDRAFAGRVDPYLGEEPMFPIEDNDEIDRVVVSKKLNRSKSSTLARGDLPANTNRRPLARSVV